ncbi:TadE/TadG family type IV pilus assembly protein [Actinospica robiniae]|uniref:TadE/TadG family type IV pilus assembly protein n=1 Tax=Actinospica robiniae TaxID=304901 RepID=UPI0009FCBEFE|nr:TadE family protein [Actinospica robiniae]
MRRPHAAHRSGPRSRDDRGSASVEAVLIMPLLIMFLLLFAALHRGTDARSLVSEAAGQAARAATLGPASSAQARALRSAETTLRGSSTCPDPGIAVHNNAAALGGSETVQITCHVPLADLALPGMPGHITLVGTATSPRDPFSSEG